MNIITRIKQALCKHIPVERYKFTRTNGTHVQEKTRYECFKCGKRMK